MMKDLCPDVVHSRITVSRSIWNEPSQNGWQERKGCELSAKTFIVIISQPSWRPKEDFEHITQNSPPASRLLHCFISISPKNAKRINSKTNWSTRGTHYTPYHKQTYSIFWSLLQALMWSFRVFVHNMISCNCNKNFQWNGAELKWHQLWISILLLF